MAISLRDLLQIVVTCTELLNLGTVIIYQQKGQAQTGRLGSIHTHKGNIHLLLAPVRWEGGGGSRKLG